MQGPSSVWTERQTYYYADGTTKPPELLRDTPEQNYLTSGARIFGFTLLGIAWFICIGNCIWIAVNRKHRVLTASQPLFLYQLALGSAIVVASIFPISFDESYGWSVDMLSAGCTSLPWLVAVGHVTQYMALFAKVSDTALPVIDYTCLSPLDTSCGESTGSCNSDGPKSRCDACCGPRLYCSVSPSSCYQYGLHSTGLSGNEKH